jgi:hypothetical protein
MYYCKALDDFLCNTRKSILNFGYPILLKMQRLIMMEDIMHIWRTYPLCFVFSKMPCHHILVGLHKNMRPHSFLGRGTWLEPYQCYFFHFCKVATMAMHENHLVPNWLKDILGRSSSWPHY